MKAHITRPDSAALKAALTYSELGQRLGVSVPTARRIVKRHRLRVMRLSATLVRIPLEEVLRFEAESIA